VSIRVMNAVWEHSAQTGSALLMLLALADFADDTGLAFPSVSRLAKKTRITPRQAWSLIKRLKAEGELTIELGGGRGRTNRYRVCLKNHIENDEMGNTENISVKPSAQNSEIQRIKTVKPASGDPSEIRHEPSVEDTSQKPGGQQSSKRSTAKRTWPDDLVLTADMHAAALKIASELGVVLDVDREFDAWHDDCLAHGRKYTDWAAAWRSRIRGIPKFGASGINGNSNDPRPQPTSPKLPTSAELEQRDRVRRAAARAERSQ
jgi:hypothetical protein